MHFFNYHNIQREFSMKLDSLEEEGDAVWGYVTGERLNGGDGRIEGIDANTNLGLELKEEGITRIYGFGE